jgi:hypothetical protein
VPTAPAPLGDGQAANRPSHHVAVHAGDVFDGIYYPCLAATVRRPYALYVHGNSGTTGAVRAVDSIASGLRWRRARPPVSVTGDPGAADLAACWELGATIAAELAP